MIKTLNDLVSVIALIIITFVSFRLFIGSLFKNSNETATHSSRLEFLVDYINNEEE